MRKTTVFLTAVPPILVPATVTDRKGKTIDGLTVFDLEVLDKGKRVKHRLEATNQPIALVAAMQTSASAAGIGEGSEDRVDVRAAGGQRRRDGDSQANLKNAVTRAQAANVTIDWSDGLGWRTQCGEHSVANRD